MKKGFIFLLALIVAIILPSYSYAMTCSQFISLGHDATNEKEVLASPATKKQISEFKKVIAEHAGEISAIGWFSDRKKALNLIMEKGLIAVYLRESLALTREKCFNRPEEVMGEVAEGEFNYLLDAVAENL